MDLKILREELQSFLKINIHTAPVKYKPLKFNPH